MPRAVPSTRTKKKLKLYFSARVLGEFFKKNMLISVPIYPRAFTLDVNLASCNLA